MALALVDQNIQHKNYKLDNDIALTEDLRQLLESIMHNVQKSM